MVQDNITFKNWRYHIDDSNICFVVLDMAGKSTNVLDLEVLEELRQLVGLLSVKSFKGLVLSSAKKNGFVAGADIREFTTLESRKEALELIEKGQGVVTAFEELPYPTVCLINGFCLGGGFELALACNYRIAADSPNTKIGLPEVKLGIHPGFGGTVRLSRLIGGPKALQVMLTGRSFSAKRAAKLGMVTYAVPERLLEVSAIKVLNKPPKKPSSWLSRLFSQSPVRSLTVSLATKKLVKKVRKEQYPAPYALLDLWKDYGGSHEMMNREAQSVADLVGGDTAQNLIRVFFLQERLKSLPADRSYAPKHVHVVGAGVMGTDIAAWCTLKGFTTSIQDNSHDILARANKRAAAFFKRKLKSPHLVTAAMDRFIPDIAGEMVGRADMVIEAVFEDVQVKKDVFQNLLPKMKPSAVLATNTSSIPLEKLAAGLDQPEKLVGLHFFNPVAQMMLVEVVQTSLTDEATVKKAIHFTKKIGKLPLPVKSSPGFLVNRILMPYLHEAAVMEAEGISASFIDQVAEEFGMPVGPIELIDLVGLDICASVGKVMTDSPVLKMPDRLQTLVDQGRLGRKSGAGYYEYSNNKPVKPAVSKESVSTEEVQERLVLRLVNESISCLREEVVSDGDMLDAGMIFGTGFAPFRGGVMHYLENAGVDVLYETIKKFNRNYGDRFLPDTGWSKLL